MTKNKKFKRKVRELQKELGCSYTAALQKLKERSGGKVRACIAKTGVEIPPEMGGPGFYTREAILKAGEAPGFEVIEKDGELELWTTASIPEEGVVSMAGKVKE